MTLFRAMVLPKTKAILDQYDAAGLLSASWLTEPIDDQLSRLLADLLPVALERQQQPDTST